ncbi:DUF2935 family protein [Scopulibacillus darangshiensis]|uniref:DUF2935 family protein n=1 Tax=Scopulibacillus darangshiensis TaxID=442528 RepID=A0A4R2P955_9BACL|nr:DUF2935 domain-containing protein [Scopulibacillus darangshiensis]TCP30591.1 DUF2935 family protein [Scopulibacillus darangshiensis]
MQYYYGGQLPLRVMDEAEFWKLQEEEHTVVIRELVKGLESKYVEALKQWEILLSETHSQIVRFIETAVRSNGSFSQELYRDLMQLIVYCLNQSEKFIAFCNEMMRESDPIKNNPTARVVMRHIIDESEYFIGIAQTILYQKA